MRKAVFLLALCFSLLLCGGSSAEATLPADTERIGTEAFMNDTGLTGILQVPGQCVSIGERAFYGTRIYGADLPASVAEIGTDAFAGNDRLAWVRLNGTPARAEAGALNGAHVVIAPAGSAPGELPKDTCFCPLDELREEGGFYYRVYGNGTAVLLCPVDAGALPATVTLPERVDGALLTGMTRWAFYGCSHLREINVTGVQTEVSNLALYQCSRATVNRPHADEITLVSVPDRIDLYANGGCGGYELPPARIRLLNGAGIETVRSEGLENLKSMCVQVGEKDSDGYADIGVWGPFSPADAEQGGISGDHTVLITVCTAHDSVTIPIAMRFHNERVRTIYASNWTAPANIVHQPGDVFTIDKPVPFAPVLANDRDWEYQLRFKTPGVLRCLSEDNAGFTVEALREGETYVDIEVRKHLTNIGDSFSWKETVSDTATVPEIRGGYDTEGELSIPVFSDGSFEGYVTVLYDQLSAQNSAEPEYATATLDDPSLTQIRSITADPTPDGAEIRFEIGPATGTGRTTLHLGLTKGTAEWTKDIEIITHADKARSRLDYEPELPAAIFSGDEMQARLNGDDADVLTLDYQLDTDHAWDFDNTIRLPAGYYQMVWDVSLKELRFRNYDKSRYNDSLSQGRTLSEDPLTGYDPWPRIIVEVRDRNQPEADTPQITAHQSRPGNPYSADISRMGPADEPWTRYDVTGTVLFPAGTAAPNTQPVITAALTGADNLPFSAGCLQMETTLGEGDPVTENGKMLWNFTASVLIDTRQSVPAGVYTCTMHVQIAYGGEQTSTDVPMRFTVVQEADELIRKLPQIPTAAKVGDIIEELLAAETIPSAAEDIFCYYSSGYPEVIDWQKKCQNPGIAHWEIWASYRNGEALLSQGNIEVTR